MVGAVLTAAGRGTRFGSAENKIWALLDGRPLIQWSLDALASHPQVDCVVITGNEADLEKLRSLAAEYPTVKAVTPGGATRQDSVGNGLRLLPEECNLVLVHDAARPLLSMELTTRLIEAAIECGASVPGLAVSDTVKRVDASGIVEETISRERLWTVQTPQAAQRSSLIAAYEKLGDAAALCTDEASLLEKAGFPVRVVRGDEQNLKITEPQDLQRAERFLMGRTPEIRTGFGYDVHQFEEGRDLWLGGVQIPHNRGLKGHSDADVVLHAVCDALLGAVGKGDIGVLFPDTDMKHKDRASIEFVQEVYRLLSLEGWKIVNVDIALLAEEPRVGAYRPAMCGAISEALGISSDRVNIKATTSEKMGFVGRREGMGCWASALVSRES